MRYYIVAAAIVLCMVLFPVYLPAQQDIQVTLSVTAQDHYTNAPLDSVYVQFFKDGMLLDSVMTGTDGTADLIVTVTRVSDVRGIPNTFSLSVNYPNPFRDETNIDVEVPEPQTLHVEVYNILGQRVARNELPVDRGYYTLNVSLGHLSTGVYFLRLSGSESRVVRMTKVGRGIRFAGELFRMESRQSYSAATLGKRTDDPGYLLRAARYRYETRELYPFFSADTSILIPMERNNIVGFASLGDDQTNLTHELEIRGENFTIDVVTPDTIILKSGIYSVRSKGDTLFSIDRAIEVASVDTAFIFQRDIPQNALVSGYAASEDGELLSGITIRIFKDGNLITETLTEVDGTYEVEILADGSIFSLAALPPHPVGSFDPDNYAAYGSDLKVLTPLPAGEYSVNFLLRRERPLSIPGVQPDSLVAPYTLSTPGGTVSVAGIPPELRIVGGSARAYSPTITADAFPGDFATRQAGFESGLTSGGFVSVNLLRDNNGILEPVSKLETDEGEPVRVTLRFRLDPADWHVIRPDEAYSHLPGYISRPDRINVPLYYYHEELGDWLLADEFGWLEDVNGVITPAEVTSIQEGTYERDIYVVGDVDHFSWYNLDFPQRDACMTGRLLDQDFKPVKFAKLTFLSMPATSIYSYFSNEINTVTDENGFFQIRVPRTETGPSDDWNGNNKVDYFRVFGTYADKSACGIAVFNNNNNGYHTPQYPEVNSCRSMGNLYVELRKAKKVNFEITFLDIQRDGEPNYPLYVSPPSFSGFNHAKATLLDNRVPLMGDIWKCTCDSGTSFADCNYQSTTTSNGVAEFTLPVLVSDDDLPLDILEYLTGTFSYRKERPDLGFGGYEFAECSYFVPENQRRRTIRCEVERRGNPVIKIIQPEPTNGDPDNPEYDFLFDDPVTLEATGEDVNENSIDHLNMFYWTNVAETRLVTYGRMVQTTAGHAFGSGTNLSIRAHGIDLYGWRGTADLLGVSVSPVEVTVEPAGVTLVPGDTVTIYADVTGANNKSVQWSSANANIAGVSSNGLVTAHNPGETVITARSVADPTKIATAIVEVENLVAFFTVSPPAGQSDTEFTFDATGSQGDIASYSWDLGDGTMISGAVVTHTYGDSAVYQVELTITGTSNLTAKTSRSVSTTGQPLVVISAEPVSGEPPLQVFFDGSGSFSPAGSIVSYLWNFGDGNDGDGDIVEHTYQQSGVYFAKLTIEDEIGRVASDSVEIIVNQPPVASFTVAPETGAAPLTVTVDASDSFDPDGEIVKYSWDFGDGTVIDDGDMIEEHTYLTSGVFTIELTVEDNFGSVSSTTRTVSTDCEIFIEGNVIVSTLADMLELFGVCEIKGDLRIIGQDISSLASLQSLQIVTGTLEIRNTLITSLSGIEHVRGMQRIFITDNAFLGSLNAFNIVTHINEIEIRSNPLISEFGSFAALKRVEQRLEISNTQISQCELIRFRERIIDDEGIGASSFFYQNADIAHGSFNITSQAGIDQLQGVCEVNGHLLVTSSPLTTLAGLDSLMVVTHGLTIQHNQHLVNLEGLNNLVEVRGTLNIVGGWDSTPIESLNGLERLRVVGGNFGIGGSHALESLAGLSRLKEVKGTLSLSNNNSMTSLQGVDNLEIIGAINIQNLDGLIDLQGLGNVRYITQGVNLSNLPAFTGLTGLESVEKIGGELSINNVSNLTDFNALESLQELSGLSLVNIPGLINLNGLENVAFVPTFSGLQANLTIYYMPNLQNLEGLENSSTFRHISIQGNSSLVSLNGLDNLQTVQSDLHISENPLLSDISALSNFIGSPNVSLRLADNPSITNLNGLGSLEKVQSLNLHRLSGLPNLNGLSSLQEVEYLTVDGNGNLTSLEGIGHTAGIGSLDIRNNNSLADLTGLHGVDNLVTLLITNNPSLGSLTGLESLTTTEGLDIRNNPQLASLSALQNLESIGGEGFRLINNGSLLNLDGLESLTSVYGFFIENNSQLQSIDALENISGHLSFIIIRNNPQLQSLIGLEGVTSVHQLELSNNASLNNLSGLSGLASITGTLNINNIPLLANLSGLESLISVGRIFIYNNNQLQNIEALGNISGELTGLSVSGCPALASLDGLEGITKINESVQISNNAVLGDISGLQGITETGSLTISGNNVLPNLYGLQNVERVNSGLWISGNPQLTSVTDMEALARVGFSFTIQSNVSLPTCDAEILRDQVLAREGIGGWITISGNDDLGTCQEELSVIE